MRATCMVIVDPTGHDMAVSHPLPAGTHQRQWIHSRMPAETLGLRR
jgi:hypothetical protein